MYSTLDSYVLNLPANLDSIFHGLVITTSASTGVEGVEPQNGKLLWFRKLDTAKWPQLRPPCALIITK